MGSGIDVFQILVVQGEQKKMKKDGKKQKRLEKKIKNEKRTRPCGLKNITVA